MNEYDLQYLTINFYKGCLMNKFKIYEYDNSQRNNDEMNYEKHNTLETCPNISYLGIVDDKEYLFNLRIVNKIIIVATKLNKCYSCNQCNYFKCR